MFIFYQEWTSKFISIEDPFDLNHNLAAGVSHKMATFITNVFVKAREHFGTLPKIELRQIDECVSIIFNRACVMSAHQIPVWNQFHPCLTHVWRIGVSLKEQQLLWELPFMHESVELATRATCKCGPGGQALDHVIYPVQYISFEQIGSKTWIARSFNGTHITLVIWWS